MTDKPKNPKVKAVEEKTETEQGVMEGAAPPRGDLDEKPVRESGKRRHRPIGKDDLPKR
jgi:hypothetical protein